MPGRQRLAVFVWIGALWLSGCLWLGLDQFLAVRGPFGTTPHPWQPPLLLIHGIVAIGSLYLLGWISARHVLRWWPLLERRWSGGMLAAALAVLAASGFALFFLVDDASQHLAAVIHEVVGVGITVFAVQHWFFAKRRGRWPTASVGDA